MALFSEVALTRQCFPSAMVSSPCNPTAATKILKELVEVRSRKLLSARRKASVRTSRRTVFLVWSHSRCLGLIPKVSIFCRYFFFIATHEKTSLTKIRKRYVHYPLLIVQILIISCSQYNTIQYLRFLQIRHCILFATLTLLTIQYLRYLQYDTYTSYNTIFCTTYSEIYFLTYNRCIILLS